MTAADKESRVKSFLYQALARSLTASSPAVSGTLTVHGLTEALPQRTRQRTPWHEPQTFVDAAAIPLPDPRQVMRYPTAEPLPVRIRKFHAEHVPVTSRDALTLPTLPMPQRTYVEATVPNPAARRFRAEQQDAATGWPVGTLPVVVRLFGGSDPLPVRNTRLGVCHGPSVSYVSPQALPVPAQTYATCDLPPRRRPFVASPVLDFNPWFQTALFPPFSASEMPARKRLTTPAPATFARDFAAPTFCWSAAPEPCRPKIKTPLDSTAFAGAVDKSPPMFGRTEQVPPIKVKTRAILDPASTSIIVTVNEQTRPGAWRFEFVMPARKIMAPAWLAPVVNREPFVGPIDGGAAGGSGISGECPAELTGTDNTTADLTGEP